RLVMDSHGAGRWRVADELDRRSGHAHADANFRAKPHQRENRSKALSGPHIAVVVTIPADASSKQALTHGHPDGTLRQPLSEIHDTRTRERRFSEGEAGGLPSKGTPDAGASVTLLGR
ncbi:MAG: hypothetical protein OXS50_10250, partial [Gammaproteobacteria bacterium]|nr:hypothetical protein [Gammaproteobacteria bacterium]